MQLIIILLMLATATLTGARQISFEVKLREELFKNRKANHLKMPSSTSSTGSVDVGVKLTLQYISLDPHKNTLSATIWLLLEWNDPELSWPSQDYDGLKSISINPTKIWTPNVTVVNNIETMEKHYGATNIVLKRNGSCTYIPAILAKTYCIMDVRHFPFDEQTCTIVIGSWTYVGNRLNIYPASAEVDSSTLIEDSEWMFVSSTSKKSVHQLSCCPELYHNVEYEVKVRRRSSYYQVTVLMPSVMSALLGLVLFWLPPTSTQKLYYGGFNVLTLLLLLLHLNMIVPMNGGDIPHIVRFCGASVALNALCLLLSLATLRLAHPFPSGNMQPAPGWLKNFLSALPSRICCLQSVVAPTSNSEDLPATKQQVNDWMLAAMLIDRLLFALYCLIYIIVIPSVFV